MKGRTKDEKFIICAYQRALQSGEFTTPVDRYEVGREIGVNVKTVDTICRLLAQANFIKFVGDTDIRLTENGKTLAESFS
jgi:Mn-dependent DtxR family transcriptional regulator